MKIITPEASRQTRVGSIGTVLGFSSDKTTFAPTSDLQVARIPIAKPAECHEVNNVLPSASQLCVGGKGVSAYFCSGDSGSALNFQQEQQEGGLGSGPRLCFIQLIFLKQFTNQDLSLQALMGKEQIR